MQHEAAAGDDLQILHKNKKIKWTVYKLGIRDPKEDVTDDMKGFVSHDSRVEITRR